MFALILVFVLIFAGAIAGFFPAMESRENSCYEAFKRRGNSLFEIVVGLIVD